MQTVVVVHKTQEDLDAWIKEVSNRPDGESQVAWGKKLYEQRGCKGCHSVDGTKMSGPSYKDSFGIERALASGEKVTVDEAYVRDSIINPKAKIAAGFAPVMPSFKGQLSDDDIESLTAYIRTLSANTPKESMDETDGTPTENPAE